MLKMYHLPSLAHLCTAGQDLTLTDCLVSSLTLIGANFNDLMKQRTINISNISIATTRCCLLPPRVLSEVFRLVPQIDPSVPQPVVQSRRRPLLGPSPG